MYGLFNKYPFFYGAADPMVYEVLLNADIFHWSFYFSICPFVCLEKISTKKMKDSLRIFLRFSRGLERAHVNH